MTRYRKIVPAIWYDAKFRALSDKARLVFFLLLTHPQTTAIGTLRAYPQGLAPELGWTTEAFQAAFAEILDKGMVVFAEEDGLIWLPNFMKYNTPESPNVLKSWVAGLDHCPECPMKNQVYERIRAFAEGLGASFAKAFAEAFGKARGLPLLNQEQEQEQEAKPYPDPAALPETEEGPCASRSSSHEAGGRKGEAAVIELPLNNNALYAVTQADVDHWQGLYPAVDIAGELRRMLGWLEANAHRRKTSRGVVRFITGWLDREQNRAGAGRTGGPLYGQASN
ncbi:MAG: hypothetical protein J5861_00650 [Desulfovibrio sp.]|nr:hypothetical protein [Desulfovibrio sp.]